MIPDFPEAKRQMKRSLELFVKSEVKKRAPVMSMSTVRQLHEGDSMGIVYPDGEHSLNVMNSTESHFSVQRGEAQDLEENEFLRRASTMAADMAGQMEGEMLQTISHAAEQAGNVISTDGKLSPDVILMALESISIDFEDDDRSKPVRPTLAVHPEVARCLKATAEAMDDEAKRNYEARENAIFDRKYEEHIRDLASRKITEDND